jgi:NADH-quinone oxidoreductase subunit C
MTMRYPLPETTVHLQELMEYISMHFGKSQCAVTLDNNELCIAVPPAMIRETLKFLSNSTHCRFKMLVDLCGVDYPSRPQRFEVVYHLLSLHYNLRARVRVAAAEDTLVPSVVNLFSNAGWYEREAWDLYGIRFDGNPDLRRILTDYGFEGHPLRKDFPLTGYVEVRYDPERQQVVYEPVQLPQDFRTFDFLSPWEGAKHILPDSKTDERKAS